MIRIANARGVPGTIGALVRDAEGALCGLTSHHVVYGDGAVLGDRVWAMPIDSFGEGATLLGRASRAQLGRVTFEGEAWFVDCALVTLAKDLTGAPAWLHESLSAIQTHGATRATRGTRVLKDGAATGTTHGVIANAEYSDQPRIGDRTWSAPRQLLIDSVDPELNFSAFGDSGAAVADELHRVVGLVWGSTSGGQGIACPIAPVLDTLAITLEDRPWPTS